MSEFRYFIKENTNGATEKHAEEIKMDILRGVRCKKWDKFKNESSYTQCTWQECLHCFCAAGKRHKNNRARGSIHQFILGGGCKKTRHDCVKQRRWGQWVNKGAVRHLKWSGESSQWAPVSRLFPVLRGLSAIDRCHRLYREAAGPILPCWCSLIYLGSVFKICNFGPGSSIYKTVPSYFSA